MINFLMGLRVVFIWTLISVTVLESIIKPCFYHAECGSALVQQFMHAVFAVAWVLTIIPLYAG